MITNKKSNRGKNKIRSFSFSFLAEFPKMIYWAINRIISKIVTVNHLNENSINIIVNNQNRNCER